MPLFPHITNPYIRTDKPCIGNMGHKSPGLFSCKYTFGLVFFVSVMRFILS